MSSLPETLRRKFNGTLKSNLEIIEPANDLRTIGLEHDFKQCLKAPVFNVVQAARLLTQLIGGEKNCKDLKTTSRDVKDLRNQTSITLSTILSRPTEEKNTFIEIVVKSDSSEELERLAIFASEPGRYSRRWIREKEQKSPSYITRKKERYNQRDLTEKEVKEFLEGIRKTHKRFSRIFTPTT